MERDTIAAISTAMSTSGIGIVRMSGSDCFTIIDKIYRSKKGNKKLSNVESHTINYGFITDEEEIVDEVLVMVMRGPGTFTGEDTIEINCHGGVLVMRRILELLVKTGARLADPGEFTKRAFLNGRLDLSQAEAVIDIINSKNDYALKSSLMQLKGKMMELINEIRSKIIYEIAFIESALDDPEHVSIDGYGNKLREIVDNISESLERLLATSENGKIMKEGVRTVIVGKPNAGKSSILNLLVGEDRAIVTDIEGTTRDILEETINLNGISLNIVDTAGIRETKDIIEKIGISKAKEQAKDADLVIYVVDSSTFLDQNDEEIIQLLMDKKVIVLLNKSDLDMKVSTQVLKRRLDKPVIMVSAKENTGMEELEKQVKEMFYRGSITFNDQIYLTNIRHKAAIINALDSMKMVIKSVEAGMPEDFFSIDLMNAYEELGKITGESVGEDLVNEIFSRFCVGK